MSKTAHHTTNNYVTQNVDYYDIRVSFVTFHHIVTFTWSGAL